MQTHTHQPRTDHPYAVVEIDGELDLDTQGSFERTVADQLGQSPVVVDLSRLDFLAIAAISSLLRCLHAAEGGVHTLRYTDFPAQAQRLLSLAGLEDRLGVRGPEVAGAAV